MLERERDGCCDLAERLGGCRRIYVVGIGTSWHAALVGASILRSGPEAFAVNSFEFCTDTPGLTGDDAVIILSHTGAKQASYDALVAAKAGGALTIAVTCLDPDPRISAADALIETTQPETSAAYTVSYTTALTASGNARRGACRGRRRDRAAAGDRARDACAGAADRGAGGAACGSAAACLAGWGAERATAYEAALKIKETSRANCEGFQIEQLLHGPFCELDADSLLTIIASDAPDRERAADLTRAARALGASVWAIAHARADALSEAVADVLRMPQTPPRLQAADQRDCAATLRLPSRLARGANPDLFQLDDPAQAAAFREYAL